MGRLTVIIAAVVLTVYTEAFPDGAGTDSCGTLIPGHGYDGQKTTSPYAIQVSSYTYGPGSTVDLQLTGSEDFKGFLLVATNQTDGSIGSGLGSFQGVGDQAMNVQQRCDGNTYLTHNKPLSTKSLMARWTAPSSDSGKVMFLATFVKDFDTYWIKVPSQPIGV